MDAAFATLQEILFRNAKCFPAHGVGFCHPDNTTTFYSFPELLSSSQVMLAGLRGQGIDRGDKLIVALEKAEEIIPVFWACMLGGIVPALLQPPVTFTQHNPAEEKIGKVYEILGRPKVVLSQDHSENWDYRNVPASSRINVNQLRLHGRAGEFHQAQPGDLAFIQFSSGSTGDPKGVMLTHRNIITNITDIASTSLMSLSDITVNWMPLYHDMGLIGFHITPMSVGYSQFFIDPADFIKNPMLLLDAISRNRGTMTGCPTFGQAIINRFLLKRKDHDFDLSSLRIIFNGAEPISVPVMRSFTENLKPFGLNPASMLPAYGLAEATLAVSFGDVLAEPEVVRFKRKEMLRNGKAVETCLADQDAIELVSLGTPLRSCKVSIVTEAGLEVKEGVIGKILVSGKNVSKGYYGLPSKTQPGDRGDWLHTGDLGFIHRGRLFITGRSKDVLSIHGVKYYAHDLENILLQSEEVSFGKVFVAGDFEMALGRDKLFIFLVGSLNERMQAVCLTIKQRLSGALGLSPDAFVCIRSSDIPRTSSGKIQRYKLITRYHRGELSQVVRL